MSDPVRGISLKIGSVFLVITMFAIIKHARTEVPPGQAVFFRSFFALPVILVWLAARGTLRTGLRAQNPAGHFWRGFFGGSGMGLTFTGLAFLPLAEAQAIQYAAPLFAVIFAAMFLREKVGLFRISTVLMGMIGVLIVLAPSLTAVPGVGDDMSQAFGATVILLSAVLGGMAQIFVRKLVMTETTSSIVFWFSIMTTLGSLLTLPFGWVMPQTSTLLLLILAGFMGGLSQVMLTASYRFADVSVIAPFEYASMLLALIIGYLAFSEVPTWGMLAGVALIVAAGVLIIWRERKLDLERTRSRRVTGPTG